MTIKVAIVDDQSLVRSGLAMILGNEDDIDIVAEASNGHEAISVAQSHQPDVILMDIRMPEMDGLQATKEILSQADGSIRILILTTFDPDEYIFQALRAGASGFVLKDIRPQDLVSAVRTVFDGGALLAPSITRRLIEKFADGLASEHELATRLNRLTLREREVLIEVARGLNNTEISTTLFIGKATVKTHVSSILAKLGLRDRAQVVVFAYEAGLVQVGGYEIGY